MSEEKPKPAPLPSQVTGYVNMPRFHVQLQVFKKYFPEWGEKEGEVIEGWLEFSNLWADFFDTMPYGGCTPGGNIIKPIRQSITAEELAADFERWKAKKASHAENTQ